VGGRERSFRTGGKERKHKDKMKCRERGGAPKGRHLSFSAEKKRNYAALPAWGGKPKEHVHSGRHGIGESSLYCSSSQGRGMT